VGRNAYDEELVALELLRRLQAHYAALAAVPLSLAAGVLLRCHAGEPGRLRPALVLGIAAALVYGLGLAWGFWMVRA
ncbi:MAG: hypothetical protein KGQ30_02680, partial [Burkholderiales bacterium]|nr:hypothetical protein [Burkholderiales bacterium]